MIGGKYNQQQGQIQTQIDKFEGHLAFFSLTGLFSYILEKMKENDKLSETVDINPRYGSKKKGITFEPFSLKLELNKDHDGNISGKYKENDTEGDLKIEKLQRLEDIINEIKGLRRNAGTIKVGLLKKGDNVYLGIFYGEFDKLNIGGQRVTSKKISIKTENYRSGGPKIGNVEYTWVPLKNLGAIVGIDGIKISSDVNKNTKASLEEILRKYSDRTYIISNDNQGYLEVILKNASNQANSPDANFKGRFLLVDLGKQKDVTDDTDNGGNGKKGGFWRKVKNFFKKVGSYIYRGIMYIGGKVAIAMDKKEIEDYVRSGIKIPASAINSLEMNTRKYISLFGSDNGAISWLKGINEKYKEIYQNAREPGPSGVLNKVLGCVAPSVGATLLTGFWPWLLVGTGIACLSYAMAGKSDSPGVSPEYIENKINELSSYLRNVRS